MIAASVCAARTGAQQPGCVGARKGLRAGESARAFALVRPNPAGAGRHADGRAVSHDCVGSSCLK
jgi:hypothetical protein